jgi:hypothetical protein
MQKATSRANRDRFPRFDLYQLKRADGFGNPIRPLSGLKRKIQNQADFSVGVSADGLRPKRDRFSVFGASAAGTAGASGRGFELLTMSLNEVFTSG